MCNLTKINKQERYKDKVDIFFLIYASFHPHIKYLHKVQRTENYIDQTREKDY